VNIATQIEALVGEDGAGIVVWLPVDARPRSWAVGEPGTTLDQVAAGWMRRDRKLAMRLRAFLHRLNQLGPED
jgi:hypothetical protein